MPTGRMKAPSRNCRDPMFPWPLGSGDPMLPARTCLVHTESLRQGGHSDMGEAGRQMHLGVFVLGTGNHMAGWRYQGAFATHMELPVMQEIARIAERGKFDLLFISDSMVMDPTDHPSFLCRFEPTTLITALSAVTTHIGLGATVSSSFNEPFNVAPIFDPARPSRRCPASRNLLTSPNPSRP